MEFPINLKYTKNHEWLLIEGPIATIGITDHAQDALGDIVYLGDFPEVGDEVNKEDVVGVVESVKATSDIFTPLTGTIVEVNNALDDAPELVNVSPYEDGWVLKIEFTESHELEDLIDVEAYEALLEEDE